MMFALQAEPQKEKKKKKRKRGAEYWIEEAEQGDVSAQVCVCIYVSMYECMYENIVRC